MESFFQGTKRKSSEAETLTGDQDDDESTDVKLALLASLFPECAQEALLEALMAHEGSVDAAATSLADQAHTSPTTRAKPKAPTVVGSQTSLRSFAFKQQVSTRDEGASMAQSPKKARLLSKKGATLHLYDPADVAEHTPCSIVHNFLPPDEADGLLREMLDEAKSFEKSTFKLFDNVVSSPHTSTFYVETAAELDTQKHDYYYNGSRITDIRRITPQLLRVKPRVQETVNKEIQHRIKTSYPGGRKLTYQSPDVWSPNVAFVNCYNGPQESVGYHSDQLTYLGPRAVIGSLSLGVAREFRVRRIVPKDGDGNRAPTTATTADADADGDAEGQIAIHLPHNSLLVMHAEMQEEWKHSIAPAQAIDPHPVAGNRRINVTYRDYKPKFHPRHAARCRCGIPAVLRVVQRKRENHGRYFWMCHGGNVPGKESCTFFQWAEFDDDGNPKWDRSYSTKARRPS